MLMLELLQMRQLKKNRNRIRTYVVINEERKGLTFDILKKNQNYEKG